MEKYCNWCNRELDITYFSKQSSLGGIIKYKSRCRECISKAYKAKYSGTWVRKALKKYVKEKQPVNIVFHVHKEYEPYWLDQWEIREYSSYWKPYLPSNHI